MASITQELLENKNSRLLSYDQRTSIHEAEKEFMVGKITPDLYLEQMCTLVNGSRTRKDLLIGLMGFFCVNEEALAIASSLAHTSQVYLFSDYPRAWLQSFENYFKLVNRFSSKNIVYAGNWTCENCSIKGSNEIITTRSAL
jgi:hypothetical protein